MPASSSSAFRRRFSTVSASLSDALCSWAVSTLGLIGFSMKLMAPLSMASTATMMLPWPLTTMTCGGWADAPEIVQQIEALDVGQHQIHQDQFRLPGGQLFARLAAR